MPPPHTRSNIRPSLAPSSAKARQLSHLNSQLAQLQANLADLEDISRVTAVQAEHIKALGSLNVALLMAAGKVLGESGAGMHNPPSTGAEAEDEEMADA
ncbi:high osmolarity sensitivity protein 3 [Sphaerosporella brunnea]|uniref:High osmolarity sensitivity protein 3 n=1 Tax=Sphaerosporella brunnea TaxID=1250544 RepID=A0A5J5EQE7_9PEZI|nr:high osmolarity sensitivity protein 3 [Sphaerosporella brunnea]